MTQITLKGKPIHKEVSMVQITLKGKPIHTVGTLPTIHSHAPDFVLVNQNLEDVSLSHFKGKQKLLATAPSIDTDVCSTMTKHLNAFAHKHPKLAILVVTADLPFAQKRFCGIEHIHSLTTLSMMRNKDFGRSYGVLIQDGPLEGVLARSLLILDEENRVLYEELVPEITQEPDYHKALAAL